MTDPVTTAVVALLFIAALALALAGMSLLADWLGKMFSDREEA